MSLETAFKRMLVMSLCSVLKYPRQFSGCLQCQVSVSLDNAIKQMVVILQCLIAKEIELAFIISQFSDPSQGNYAGVCNVTMQCHYTSQSNRFL